MSERLFEQAFGIAVPWSVGAVQFDEAAKTLTITIDFKAGSRFAVAGRDGAHPVHDTVVKTYRHMNFFQRECHLQVRTPRVKLPDSLKRQTAKSCCSIPSSPASWPASRCCSKR